MNSRSGTQQPAVATWTHNHGWMLFRRLVGVLPGRVVSAREKIILIPMLEPELMIECTLSCLVLQARYKQSLDPTVDEVKKLCTSLRRNAKEERVLFHYNGHGVPRPTVNGEIWVFNKVAQTQTQTQPPSDGIFRGLLLRERSRGLFCLPELHSVHPTVHL